MHSVRAPAPRPHRLAIVPDRLESCIRRLDPADRALLDLSLNRGVPDAAMAPILKIDPVRLAWKRARALECVASRIGLNHPADLGEVRSALMDLPSRAWLPLELQPARAPALIEPPEPEGAEIVVRHAQTASNKGMGSSAAAPSIGRAASFTLGGLSERAKRAYPRGGMTTHARRAAGALALGAAAVLALKRR
jgi:hypothetical protein